MAERSDPAASRSKVGFLERRYLPVGAGTPTLIAWNCALYASLQALPGAGVLEIYTYKRIRGRVRTRMRKVNSCIPDNSSAAPSVDGLALGHISRFVVHVRLWSDSWLRRLVLPYNSKVSTTVGLPYPMGEIGYPRSDPSAY